MKLGRKDVCLFLLICISCYLRPRECLELRRKHLLRPVTGITSYWAVEICPEEEGSTTKTGETDVAIRFDCEWMDWSHQFLPSLKEGDAS